MQYKKVLVNLLLLGVMFLVGVANSGCSSTPNKANVMQDHQAKLFKTHPEKSNLYIYRDNMQGASAEVELMLDGRHVATSSGKTYIKLEVVAGKHRIVSRADNMDKLVLATLKNKNYFIFQDVKDGPVGAHTKLMLVSESVGEAGVKQCEMISVIAQPPTFSMLQK